MLRLLCLTLGLCGAVSFTAAQFTEDFSDGNLTENPVWSGDRNDFIVENQMLRLQASQAGSSILYTPVNLKDSIVWEVYIRMDFAPSGSNQLRIYLWAADTALATADAYYLEIGATGSDDALRFFKRSNGNAASLAAGTTGAVGSDPVIARVRVRRDEHGNWSMEADYSGGFNFQTEATFTDTTFDQLDGLFALACFYTSTRTDRFYFDDIRAQLLLPDTTAPALISAEALSSTEVVATFSEPLDTATAFDISNYNIDKNIGMPGAVFWTSASQRKVTLFLSAALQSGEDYTLRVNDVADVNGNAISNATTSFRWLNIQPAGPFDILINEIMADPSPPVRLPEVEYVELYNRSDKIVALSSILFQESGTPSPLPDTLIFPNEYVLLCDEDDTAVLSPFGKLIPLASLALTNSGESLLLLNADGQVIHSVNYTREWYGNPEKDDGGYSLELINPQTPCLGADNWTAAVSISGGTPGAVNSVHHNSPDEVLPDLLRAYPDSDTTLELTFSEGLAINTAGILAFYEIVPPLAIEAIRIDAPTANTVKIHFAEALQSGQIYEVRVAAGVQDCAGNPVGMEDRARFALPQMATPSDIVINEILFDPATGGSDFVELYNRSSKVFDLRSLSFENRQAANPRPFQVAEKRLFFPGEYLVFTEDAPYQVQNYSVPHPDWLIHTTLPAFNDDAGNVTLYQEGIFAPELIESVDYSASWHSALLDDPAGVSLERIATDAPSQSPDNWYSAAGTAGFATPTAPNSQSLNQRTATVDFFEIPERVFSPDGDGFKDFLVINFEMNSPGYILNVKIFDAAGREVRQLYSNELLPVKGFLRWDGTTDSGERVRLGIYIIWLEIFNENGNQQQFKESTVVAGQLD